MATTRNRVTKKGSKFSAKKTKVDNSAEAKSQRRKANIENRKNASKNAQKAKSAYSQMTARQKLEHAKKAVFSRAIRNGASEAEANMKVEAYMKKRRANANGKGATAVKNTIMTKYGAKRKEITKSINATKNAYKKARDKANKIESPAKKKAAKAAAKNVYDRTMKQLVKERAKVIAARKGALEKHATKYPVSSRKPKGSGASQSGGGKGSTKVPTAAAPTDGPKKRGRKPGSKNKPKETVVETKVTTPRTKATTPRTKATRKTSTIKRR